MAKGHRVNIKLKSAESPYMYYMSKNEQTILKPHASSLMPHASCLKHDKTRRPLRPAGF